MRRRSDHRVHPQLFHAYVGVGQLIDSQENFRLSYEYTLERARKRGDRRALAALRAIGPPPYPRQQARRRFLPLTRWQAGSTRSAGIESSFY